MKKTGKPLAVGTRVRVYRTGKSTVLWFNDPATGRIVTERSFTTEPYVWGRVRNHHTGETGEDLRSYDVTVIHEGRELYLTWCHRNFVRRWWERGPKFAPGMKPRKTRPIKPAGS